MPDFSLESALTGRVAGIDEAGRGPLAGPVTAAAVIFDRDAVPAFLINNLDDSKKLKPALRDTLFDLIQAHATFGIGMASVEEIDRINILQATFLAMTRAVEALGPPPDHALVDGNRAPPLPCAVQCVVKGDGISLSIAAASIIAKVTRDRLMTDLCRQFPGYGWSNNAGYGTQAHQNAIRTLGLTPHHRRSFKSAASRVLESLDS